MIIEGAFFFSFSLSSVLPWESKTLVQPLVESSKTIFEIELVGEIPKYGNCCYQVWLHVKIHIGVLWPTGLKLVGKL